MTTLESRIAAIERQLGFHRLVIAGLLVILMALVGYGATEGVPEEVRTKRLVVEGPDGAGFSVFSNPEDGSMGMLMLDKDSKPKLVFANLHGEKTFNLFGTPLVIKGSKVEIQDKRQKSAVVLGSDEKVGGIVGVFSTKSEGGVWLAGDGGNGAGAIGIRNKVGKEVVQIQVDKDGMGYVGAFDRQGRGRTLTPR